MIFVRIIVLVFLNVFSFAMGTIPSSEANAIAKLVGPLFFIFAPALYLLPTYEGFKNNAHNLTSIALVNIFLGWSLVGWLVALIWAINKSPPSPVVVVNQANNIPEPPDAPNQQATKICPECAETVLFAAKKCKHCGSSI
jgi:hypothetical protein